MSSLGWRLRAHWAPLGVVLAAGLLFLPNLAGIDLWAPDEPRYAQVAEELRRQPNGAVDWVVLRLNGEVYTQKPPLYYWLVAGLGALGGGVDEWAARLPSALAGIGVVALTIFLGRRLLGSELGGALAGLVLLTLPRFAHQARRAQLDVALTLFQLLALTAYWLIDRDADPRRGSQRVWLGVFHGSIGLAILTKGPVGALPWLIAVLHRLWERKRLRPIFPVWGIGLALAPALAWLGLATLSLATAGGGVLSRVRVADMAREEAERVFEALSRAAARAGGREGL